MSLQEFAAASYALVLDQGLKSEWEAQVWDRLPPSEGMPSAVSYTRREDWLGDAFPQISRLPVEVAERWFQLSTHDRKCIRFKHATEKRKTIPLPKLPPLADPPFYPTHSYLTQGFWQHYSFV